MEPEMRCASLSRSLPDYAHETLREITGVVAKFVAVCPTTGNPFARAFWRYFPGQTGLRFSAKAFSPSLASSVIAVSAIWLSV